MKSIKKNISLLGLLFFACQLFCQVHKDTSILYSRYSFGLELGITGFGGFGTSGEKGVIPLNSSPLIGATFAYSPRHGLFSFASGLRWKQALMWRNIYADQRSKGVVVMPIDMKMNFLRRKSIGFSFQYGVLFNFHSSDYRYCPNVSKSILSYWSTRTGGSINYRLTRLSELRLQSFFILHGQPWTPRCNQYEWFYARGIEVSLNLIKKFGYWSWN